MKNIVLIILLQIISVHLHSQNIVVDKINKKSIPNVNISVKNTDKGFITDVNGVFYIDSSLKRGSILSFTAIGYKKKEIKFKNKKQLYKIELDREIENIDEVILNISKQKTKISQLGVIKSRKSVWNIIGKNYLIATRINSLNNRDDGTIQSLIVKKIKVKFIGQHNFGNLSKPKFKNIKFKNTVAIKLQLYSVNKDNELPNLQKPLINNDNIIVLSLNSKKIELDISDYSIRMPKNGVFITLEIVDVYDTNSRIEFLKESHVLMYNMSGDLKEGITYFKPFGYEWIKQKKGNAIFSLKVAYPVKK